MHFYVLTDIEGVSGVTTFAQAEKEPFGIEMLMNDVRAVVEGLMSNPENEVTLYDEHTDGCNLQMEQLPPSVRCVRGKPLEGREWKGITSEYDALVMVGFHARAGSEGALLPHTYSLRNRSIRVNGQEVGEIGIEAMIVGERGVPLALISGDSAGVREAEALAPGVIGVPVKVALGATQAICYPPQRTCAMLRVAASSIAWRLPPVRPVRAAAPVRLEIVLEPGPFLQRARAAAAERFAAAPDTLLFAAEGLSDAWNAWLRLERGIAREIGI